MAEWVVAQSTTDDALGRFSVSVILDVRPLNPVSWTDPDGDPRGGYRGRIRGWRAVAPPGAGGLIEATATAWDGRTLTDRWVASVGSTLDTVTPWPQTVDFDDSAGETVSVSLRWRTPLEVLKDLHGMDPGSRPVSLRDAVRAMFDSRAALQTYFDRFPAGTVKTDHLARKAVYEAELDA